jgi:ribosomal protein S18 acetylase RimI-like enzyme
MPIRMRPYAGERDLELITDLVRAAPAESRHLVDLPWRLAPLALQSGEDAHLWEGDDGALVGFAAWQAPWATLDFFVLPGAWQASVEEQMFGWAAERFRALDRERGWPLPYWAEAQDDDVHRLDLLARHGFTLDDDYHLVHLGRSLADEIPAPALPEGCAIRPLAGEREVEAYAEVHRAAFGSTAMTAEWRQRTLRAPQYRPALDLVAVAPDGRLAGFCVCWLALERRTGQIEPIGVHPDYQRSGLGRALQLEALRRLRGQGADTALVETESTRTPARRAYESVGFGPSTRSCGRADCSHR